MIKPKGTYQLSKDGGRSWISADNMLLKGYYDNAMGGMALQVGEGRGGDNYEQEALTKPLSSSYNANFEDTTLINHVDSSSATVTKSRLFDFGTGIVKSISEVGVVSNGVLISRALLRGAGGQAVTVEVSEFDHLLIRYMLEYTIPKTPINVAIDYKGESLSGVLRLTNINKWGRNRLSEPVLISYLGVANDIVLDPTTNATLSGSISESILTYGSELNTNNSKSYVFTSSAALNELVGTHNQLVFTNSSPSLNNVVAVISLDAPLVKTTDDLFSVSLSLTQRA